MSLTLQIVDPDDETTVLFDMNDPTGANNASFGGLKTYVSDFDLGTVPTNLQAFEPDASPGGFKAYSRHGLRTPSWGQCIKGSTDGTAQSIVDGFGELQRLLEAGGVIKYIPTSGMETRYIDFIGVDQLAALHSTPRKTVHLFEQLLTPEGVPIAIVAQPYLRGDEIDSDSNKLKNATLAWVGSTANRPGNWAWSSTSNISSEAIATTGSGPLPGWTGAFYQFAIATTSARSLQQTTDASSFASGDIVTVSFYVKASAASILRAQAAIQFKQSDGTTNVGSEFTGTLTAIGTSWTRVSVTTTAAGVNTSRAVVSLRFENASASSVTASLAGAQAEVASSASKFRVGTEPVYNDPASTGGYGRVVPVYVQGDAPVPLVVESTYNTLGFNEQRLALRSRGDLASYLNTGEVVQAEGFTPSADTTASAGGATYSGSGSNTMVTTFATQAVLTPDPRMTFSSTSVFPSALRDGVWEVWVRVAAATSAFTGTIQLKWGLAPGVVSVTEREVTIASLPIAVPQHVKIGRIAAPAINMEGLNLEIYASRTSGTATLVWDFFSLVPVDESLVKASLTSPGLASGQSLTVDAEEQAAYVLESGLYQRSWELAGPPGLRPPAGLSLVYLDAAESSSIGHIVTLSTRHSSRYYG